MTFKYYNRNKDKSRYKDFDLKTTPQATPDVDGFCCDEMEEAVNDRFIGLGEYERMLNQSTKMCIYKCNPWPEGTSWYETEINFCPFCGEKIVTEECQ